MTRIDIETRTLVEFLNVLKVLAYDIKFQFQGNEIKARTVDPAHVAMVFVSLKGDKLPKYEVKDTIEIGLDVENILEFFQRVKGHKMSHLTIETDKSRLKIQLGNITRYFRFIDTAGLSDPKMPTLNLPNTVKIETEYLRQALKAGGDVSDHIAIIIAPDIFEMNAGDDKGSDDSIQLKLPKELTEDIDAKERSRSIFPLDYLEQMVRAIKSDKVIIRAGTDYPVYIKWKFQRVDKEETVDIGRATYMLAPRIESE